MREASPFCDSKEKSTCEASPFCDSKEKFRPKLVSVKRNEEGERSEDFLFERSEFNVSASRTQSHACMSFAEAQPNFTFGVNLQRADRME